MTKEKDRLLCKKDNESLKIKLRWREVAIENVKHTFSDCRESIRNRDSTIDILRHSLSVMHQTYAGMVIEFNSRECKLQESYTKISDLRTDLALSRSQTAVAQSCISRGNILIAVYQNTVQELITEQDTMMRTLINFADCSLIKQQISQLTIKSTFLTKQSPEVRLSWLLTDYCSVW